MEEPSFVLKILQLHYLELKSQIVLFYSENLEKWGKGLAGLHSVKATVGSVSNILPFWFALGKSFGTVFVETQQTQLCQFYNSPIRMSKSYGCFCRQ